MWLAVDRNRNQVIDISISTSRDAVAFIRLAERLERKEYKVNVLCTDKYEAYRSYALAKTHCATKAETSLVESKNSLIRNYLARFNRRTKRYSKSLDMAFASLLILFYKKLLLSIFI